MMVITLDALLPIPVPAGWSDAATKNGVSVRWSRNHLQLNPLEALNHGSRSP